MAITRIFYNGKVYTVDKSNPWAEAVAIEDKKIAFVGSNEETLKLADDNTEKIDLQGKMMMPGFIDGHVHPLMGAAFESGAVLTDCKTKDEILSTLKEYIDDRPDYEAYFGYGFNEGIFINEMPMADDLDTICPDKPVLLLTSSCHCAWCNHKAFEVAGVDKNTQDITPGSNYFARDHEGNPTGWCVESCYFQVAAGANYFPLAVLKKAFINLADKFASEGYTTFADLGDYDFITNSLDEDFAKFINSDEFPQRFFGGFYFATSVRNMLHAIINASDLIDHLQNSDKLAFTTFKILGDGVLEAKSAAMITPYDNGVTVIPNFNEDEMKIMGLLVATYGYDINVHAIGDATTKLALDMAEEIRKRGFNDTRITLSHSQCFAPGQIERAGKLGVFINTTGAWHYVTSQEYKKLGGMNVQGDVYPLRSLMNAGCKFGYGTDFPVSAGGLSPFESIEIGIRRRQIGYTGPDPTDIGEAPTLEESIEACTINNAWQVRMEDKLGSIEKGKLADLIVVDKNLFDIPVNEIHTVKVLETIRGGQTIYKA